MADFKFGDWVMYDPGYVTQVGRVASVSGDNVYVCYHNGCTASNTPADLLRPATDAEVANASAGIGFHRFDEYCPKRMEDVCYMCRAKLSE